MTLAAELTSVAARNPTAPAVPVVEHLLGRAIESGASDLHVEPTTDAWTVRLRLDGVLHEVARFERRTVPTLVARLKVLADLPTYVTDVPQDGRIPAERARARTDLRLSVIPTIYGEKAVVRLFDPSARLLAVHELGLPADAAAALERAVLAPRGVVVLTGPAGSGKSTTIHGALRLIQERSRGRRSIVGIEDPVERVLDGVTQTQVTAAFGFADALKALLRQDPEVIYLGEVRDGPTAAVAIEAGLTGHLVITTVHSGSCAQALARFLDMGVEPHVLTTALSAVFAQRLMRRRCRDGPCERCQETGYKGRVPAVEHLVPTSALRKLILARADEETFAAEHARAGTKLLLDHARELVGAGVTTQEELERVFGV